MGLSIFITPVTSSDDTLIIILIVIVLLIILLVATALYIYCRKKSRRRKSNVVAVDQVSVHAGPSPKKVFVEESEGHDNILFHVVKRPQHEADEYQMEETNFEVMSQNSVPNHKKV